MERRLLPRERAGENINFNIKEGGGGIVKPRQGGGPKKIKAVREGEKKIRTTGKSGFATTENKSRSESRREFSS